MPSDRTNAYSKYLHRHFRTSSPFLLAEVEFRESQQVNGEGHPAVFPVLCQRDRAYFQPKGEKNKTVEAIQAPKSVTSRPD